MKESVWRGVARELARWHGTMYKISMDIEQVFRNLPVQPNIWATVTRWLDGIPNTSVEESKMKKQLETEFKYLKQKLMVESGRAEV